MKIKDYTPDMAPIILGDFGVEPKEFKKLSEEEIIAMQPASTRKILQMSDEEHVEWLNRPEPENWKAAEIKIEAEVDENGDLISIQAGDRKIEGEQLKTYLNYRKTRELESFYRGNRTPLIHRDNNNGALRDLATHERWQLRKAEKIAEPSHPLFVQAPESEWNGVSALKAFIHWLKGDKVRRVDD